MQTKVFGYGIWIVIDPVHCTTLTKHRIVNLLMFTAKCRP